MPHREGTEVPRPVRIYVSAVLVLGVLAFAWSAHRSLALPQDTPHAFEGTLALAVLGLLLQLSQHPLAVGSAKGSIAFIVYFAATLLLGPVWGAAIVAVDYGLAELLARKPALKVGFNVAQHVLAVVLAATVYESLGGVVPPKSFDASLLPFAGLVLTFFVINSTAVSGVVALSEGLRFAEVWLRNTWSWVAYDLVASALALGVAWLYLSSGVWGLLFLILPILFVRHTYFVNLQLQATNRELLELMVKAIEARDPYTSGHSQRVSELARALAGELGLHLRQVDDIATAALLHDVGKIYEEFAPILRKEGKLSPEERAIMQSHAIKSADLVGTISNLRGRVQKYIRHHHENFDGSGYPDGLSGDRIPLGARIILVADTADAMTTDRPYRKALTYEHVVRELDRLAGRQFDPEVVAAFKRSVKIRRLVTTGRRGEAGATAAVRGTGGQLAAH